MRGIILCLLIFIHSGFSAASEENATLTFTNPLARADGRIVGGVKAKAGEYPFVVSLQRSLRRSHFCGGSLISERWVVTAAHCMFDENGRLISPSSFFVVAGEIQFKPGSQRRQESQVEKLIVNPKYDSAWLSNDIALLLLRTPLTVTSYVKFIPLQVTKPSPNVNCTIAGWGYLLESLRPASNDLMYITVPLLNQTLCQRLLGDLIYMGPSVLCAGLVEGGKDACQGDSGGPLFCEKQLTGIVSGGEGCARPKRPGFYTNVYHYNNWIAQVMKSNGSNAAFEGKTAFIPANGYKINVPGAAQSHFLVGINSLLIMTVFICINMKI